MTRIRTIIIADYADGADDADKIFLYKKRFVFSYPRHRARGFARAIIRAIRD